MKLLIHDTLATAPLVYPLQAGWIGTDLDIEFRPTIFGVDANESTAALLPAAEIALLHESHQIVPEVAVIAENMGDIAMRVPVRPDEVERSVIRLYDTSGTAEILARATVEPFYGIVPANWSREESADAQVVIVEGADALRAPEAGFSEDLVRAWFILTGEPVVSHVLVVPKSADPAEMRELLEETRRTGHERRRDLRKAVSERFEIDRDRLTELAAASRFELTDRDRRALIMLLQRGNKGSTYPYVWQIDYAGDPADATQAE